MIKVINISKKYGKKIVLNDINLDFQSGAINALLGHNGSGKTTLLKIILNLVKPTKGDIEINNQSIINKWDYRKDIGYMAQIANFPENITPNKLFELITKLRKAVPTNKDYLIEQLNLADELDKPLKNLSGGTKQKVNAVSALMFDLPIFILDEPTAGLDPVASRTLKKLLLKEKSNGKTIILTSHILSDIEQLSDCIHILNDGNIIFSGSKDKLITNGNLEKAISKLYLSIGNKNND